MIFPRLMVYSSLMKAWHLGRNRILLSRLLRTRHLHRKAYLALKWEEEIFFKVLQMKKVSTHSGVQTYDLWDTFMMFLHRANQLPGPNSAFKMEGLAVTGGIVLQDTFGVIKCNVCLPFRKGSVAQCSDHYALFILLCLLERLQL